MHGKIIKLLSYSVVPFITDQRGNWSCVVVESRNKSVVIGSFVIVHEHELQAGKEMTLAPVK